MTTDVILAPLLALTIPDETTLLRRAQATLDFAQTIVIDSPIMFEIAADELKVVKAAADRFEKGRKELVGPLNEVVKTINGRYKPAGEFFAQAETIIKRAMLTYQQAEQRKADEDRMERERAAQAERDRLAAEAKALDAEGREGEAFVKRETAAMVVASPVQTPAPPTAKGISTSSTIDFEVVDILALVKHVAQNPELIGLVIADSVRLRAFVKGLGMACALPGVRVFVKQNIVSRKG